MLTLTMQSSFRNTGFLSFPVFHFGQKDFHPTMTIFKKYLEMNFNLLMTLSKNYNCLFLLHSSIITDYLISILCLCHSWSFHPFWSQLVSNYFFAKETERERECSLKTGIFLMKKPKPELGNLRVSSLLNVHDTSVVVSSHWHPPPLPNNFYTMIQPRGQGVDLSLNDI